MAAVLAQIFLRLNGTKIQAFLTCGFTESSKCTARTKLEDIRRKEQRLGDLVWPEDIDNCQHPICSHCRNDQVWLLVARVSFTERDKRICGSLAPALCPLAVLPRAFVASHGASRPRQLWSLQPCEAV